RRLVQAAAPRLETTGGWQHLVVARPPGPAGSALHDTVARAFPDLPLTPVDSDGDVVFCSEAAHLSLPDVAYALIEQEGTYTELARKMTTRVDVSWTP